MRELINTEGFVAFLSPPFVDLAVTDAPFTAFVPTSILTFPDAVAVSESIPRSMIPLPVTTIFKIGLTRALIVRPFTTPVAVPGNASFHTTGDESAPLQTTEPVPIFVAANDPTLEIIIPAVIAPVRSFLERECIFILIKKIQCKRILSYIFYIVKIFNKLYIHPSSICKSLSFYTGECRDWIDERDFYYGVKNSGASINPI